MLKNRFFYPFFILLILSFFLPLNYYLNAEEIKFVKKIEIGSEEKKEEMFFKITDIKADKNGNIFILDSKENCIKKFSKKGEFLKEAGRQGQGPGEMRGSMGLDIDQKGNIFVNDYSNRRVNVYNNDLEYIKSIKLERPIPFEKFFIYSENELLMFHSVRIFGDKYFYIFSHEGEIFRSFFSIMHPYAPKMKSMEEIRNYLSTFCYIYAVANINQHKTKIAFAHGEPENPYKIYILNANGDIIKLIKNKITGYDPKKQRDYWNYFYKHRTCPKDFKLLRHISSLHFTKENYLIVQRKNTYFEDGLIKKILFKIEIYSPEGDLIEEEMEFNAEILSVDSHDNVYTRVDDEKGTPKVVVYSLEIKN